MIFSISSFIAGLVGVVTFFGAMVNAMIEDDKPRYVVPREGLVYTQYTPQAPPTYNYNQQQPMAQPVPQPVAPSMMVPQYQQPYVWGTSAYINTIANTPMVTPAPTYTPYYQYGYVQPKMGYMSSPKVFEYNVDYSNGGMTRVNQNMMTRGTAAPPGQMYQTYPYSRNNYSYQYQYTSPQYSYNYNRYNYNPNDAYARTYANGNVSFCKIPSCYNNDGTWRG